MSKSAVLVSDIAHELWRNKFIYAFLILIVNVAIVLFSLSLPNKYKASATVVTVNSANNLTSQSGLGGLAALAGVSIGANPVDTTSQALIYLKSKSFINEFIEKHELHAELFAVKAWKNEQLVYDESLYNVEDQQWLSDEKGLLKPSQDEAHIGFLDMLEVNYEKSKGLMKLSMTHVSPEISSEVANLLIEDINLFMEKLEIKKATEKMAYLRESMANEAVNGVNNFLSDLYEKQYKQIMLASINEGFVFQFIDRASPPENKVSPKRSILCIVGFIFSFLLCIAFSIIKILVKREE